jgi:hypothetical protein
MTPRMLAQRRKALRPRFTLSLVLRRGALTLTAQLVTMYELARASRDRRTEGGQAQQADVEVWGATDLDIAPGDRFTWNGSVCEVLRVRTERQTAIVAEAVTIQ